MSISPPIDMDDLDTLPDNSTLIEDLYDKDEITTVLPRFFGTEDTGRFVTAFFVFQDTTVTLYTRRHTDDGTSTLEKQTTKELSDTPTILGDLWNQTILIDTPDINTIEHLKQRTEYDTSWLSYGHDPEIPFNDYQREPFNSTPTGLPDCDHTETDDPVQTPNLALTVTLCKHCNAPLILGTPDGVIKPEETLRTDYIGIPTSSDHPVRGKSTTPTGELTNAEITLHVLSRLAHAEQSHFEIYARNNDHGYLITLDDTVAGYALWNEFDGHVALQQIYILPQFRGSHLGEILVDAWYDQVDTDHYYAVGPNNAGTATLERAGHIDDNIATPATILSCRDTLNPGVASPTRADRARRDNNPL